MKKSQNVNPLFTAAVLYAKLVKYSFAGGA